MVERVFDGLYRREEVFRAVEMRAETPAFGGDFTQIRKTEDLIPSRVGENRMGPGHELVQTAELADEFVAGSQIEMIGIREDNFGAELLERFLTQALNGRGGADGQEERRFDRAVRRR